MMLCYVILHYKTEQDTIECIQSIFDSDDESLVVVVDNASNNGSIEKVEKEYGNCGRVTIIRNQQNLGFAAGNNIGYKYARDQLHADFIAISNNDIIVVTKDFSKMISQSFEKTKFHVMGPDIISIVDGGHQNPMEEPFHSAREVKREIRRYQLLLLLSKTGIYDLLKHNKKVRTGTTRREIPNECKENVTLHGSFVIFSPKFISREELSFREGTFLYTEEAILKRYCSNKGYKLVFDPSLCVKHKEDSSTNSLKLTNKERREFVFKNMITSLGVYLKYF